MFACAPGEALCAPHTPDNLRPAPAIRPAATARPGSMAFDYYRSGAETETSVADNRSAFERYRVVPRIMRDVSAVDTSTQLLGAHVRT